MVNLYSLDSQQLLNTEGFYIEDLYQNASVGLINKVDRTSLVSRRALSKLRVVSAAMCWRAE